MSGFWWKMPTNSEFTEFMYDVNSGELKQLFKNSDGMFFDTDGNLYRQVGSNMVVSYSDGDFQYIINPDRTE